MWSVEPTFKQMRTQKLSLFCLISLFFTLIYFSLLQMYKWKDWCGLFDNTAWWWYFSAPKIYVLMDKSERVWNYFLELLQPSLQLQLVSFQLFSVQGGTFPGHVLLLFMSIGVKELMLKGQYTALYLLEIPFCHEPSLEASCAQLYSCFIQKC